MLKSWLKSQVAYPGRVMISVSLSLNFFVTQRSLITILARAEGFFRLTCSVTGRRTFADRVVSHRNTWSVFLYCDITHTQKKTYINPKCVYGSGKKRESVQFLYKLLLFLNISFKYLKVIIRGSILKLLLLLSSIPLVRQRCHALLLLVMLLLLGSMHSFPFLFVEISFLRDSI